MYSSNINYRNASLAGGSVQPLNPVSSCAPKKRRCAASWRSNNCWVGSRISCKAEGGHSAIGDGDIPQVNNLLDPSTRGHLSMAKGQQAPQAGSTKQQGVSVVSASVSANQAPEWASWLSYFQQADSAAEKKEELALELKEAVTQERYGDAARLKAEINALEAGDAVAFIQKQLQSALAEERYKDAADLRDEGLTGIQGWWAGQAEDDPVGHLLHIKAEYSRWTGRVFRSREIADMKVRKPDIVARAMPRAVAAPVKPTGSPIMEVFIRPGGNDSAPGSASRHVHQAVSLRLPTFDELEKRRSKGSQQTPSLLQSEEEPDEDPPPSFDQVVRLSVSIRHDGTTRIRPLPPKPVRSEFKAWEAAEAQETMHMLRRNPERNTSSDSSSSSSSTFSSRSDAVVVEPDEVVQMPEIPDEVIDISSQNAMSSLEDGEDSPVTVVPEATASEPGTSAFTRFHDSGLGLEEYYAELTRDPARIELVNRDQLVFHVPDGVFYKQPGAKARPAGAGPAGAAPERSRPKAYSSPATLLRQEDSVLSEEDSSSFEFIIPMAPVALLSQEPEADALLSPSDAVPIETLNILADQLAQSMEARVGHAAPREEIAEALREVVRRVASGEPVSSVDVLLGGSGSSASFDEAPSGVAELEAEVAADAMTSITYKRIPSVGVSTSDPLSGLYMGSFGPHGPELLHLTRGMVDGEELVQAMKLTGDANVPAGSVSFRAKVGRKHRLDTRDVYPDELGIMARYKGEGRVAQKGFTQPRWVEGELLVFNAKGSPVTGGAQLGFVWAVPGEKRFLILLNRVDLSDVGK